MNAFGSQILLGYLTPGRPENDDFSDLCCDFSIRQTHRRTLLLVLVEDEDSRRLRHVVNARDRRERGEI